jgi:flagellin-like protein
MKANQKFRGSDEAVSPVIAVILMVAITVVLSATVYVWVSGFGGNNSSPARAITLSSDGPIAGGVKTYSVSAASPSLRYNDVTFTLNGVTLALDVDCAATGTDVAACRGVTVLTGTSLIVAGDSLSFVAAAGDTLRIVDAQANSVLATITIG